MSLHSTPDIKLDLMCPYMVETAFNYFMTAQTASHKKGVIQNVLSALSIEIIIKSYYAVISDKKGSIDERYKIEKEYQTRSHNLRDMLEKLPPRIREYLFSESDLIIISRNPEIFQNSRYLYEPGVSSSSLDALDRLAASVIYKTVMLYKHNECEDSFISLFGREGFDSYNFYRLYVSKISGYAYV
ncbi:hypothetical protein ACNAT8_26795 [Klebsiella quasipneumoniae]|uniref:Uncharacterized protein n=1 Tax=Klebsiella michiganensis TaxID=1134687 RepID=A0AAJ1NTZ5_9ENTR|nr:MULTISPECIES: hypothetical protein [Klebsiella]MBC4859521.1 hypothetical protein [Klebsiella pneumoniae]MDH0964472.1 hypothetical protein [Klebsiella michiganensis]MDZ1466281.1 hypothetical protein [Klebsiella quasipneumoniae]WPI68213.1 hypothetical protein R8543_30750 [Klebsiella oxytoca]